MNAEDKAELQEESSWEVDTTIFIHKLALVAKEREKLLEENAISVMLKKLYQELSNSLLKLHQDQQVTQTWGIPTWVMKECKELLVISYSS